MISSRQKVTLSRDDYRDFTQKVAQLEEANYEFVHVVTHNKEEDTFTIEVRSISIQILISVLMFTKLEFELKLKLTFGLEEAVLPMHNHSASYNPLPKQRKNRRMGCLSGLPFQTSFVNSFKLDLPSKVPFNRKLHKQSICRQNHRY